MDENFFLKLDKNISSANFKENKVQKLLNFLYNNQIVLGILVFLIVLTILFTIDFSLQKLNDKDFWENVLVEAHGLIFDIILFSIIIVLINRYGENRHKINNYKENIYDFLGWKEKEASYRISGLIRRLNALKAVRDFSLSYANLKNGYLPDINYSNVIFGNTNLESAFCIKSKFYSCDFEVFNFKKANLNKCQMSNGVFQSGSFKKANLCDAIFHTSTLNQINFNKINSLNFNVLKSEFNNCSIQMAYLEKGKFFENIFINNNFSNTCLLLSWFNNCTFKKCNFENSDISGVRFFKCEFIDCNFDNIKLNDFESDNATYFKECTFNKDIKNKTLKTEINRFYENYIQENCS